MYIFILLQKTENELAEKDEEIIKSDLSSLSKKQLLDLFSKESPEYFELVEDYKGKKNVLYTY